MVSRRGLSGIGAALLCGCLLLAGQAWAETEASGDDLHWPLPWRAGRVLVYDQQYETTNRRDGKTVTVSGTDALELRIVRADEDGFVQRWTSTDPKLELAQLPEALRLPMKAAVDAFAGLPLDVSLDRQGAYRGLANLDTLQPVYRKAMEQLVADMLAQSETPATDQGRAMMATMTQMLTTREVIEQEMAEIPAAYNFVAGGGLEPGMEYTYEDEGLAALDQSAIKRTNKVSLEATDDADVYRVQWRIEPDNAAVAQLVRKAVDEMLAGQFDLSDPKQKAEYDEALAKVGDDADYSTNVSYLVDATTGIVQRMEHVQVERIGKKDETTTIVLTLRD